MSGQDEKPRKTRQLTLDFPESRLSIDRLSVTPANRVAIAMLKRWPDWRQPAVALVGKPKSGLTTAARAWADHAGGELLDAKTFSRMKHRQVEALSSMPVAIDLAQDVTNEDNLLSIINLSSRAGGSLLLTGHASPARWRVKLPDLESRLKAMTLIELGPPDDEMLSLRLEAAMKRRFLKLPDDVEAYLKLRLERSYTAIESFVEILHQMAEGREITVPLAREVLDQMDGTRPLFDGED